MGGRLEELFGVRRANAVEETVVFGEALLPPKDNLLTSGLSASGLAGFGVCCDRRSRLSVEGAIAAIVFHAAVSGAGAAEAPQPLSQRA
mmetsp:Transcript_17264/g.46774  ORF Transcript_17264/g.46774 Transcript_17264/m.46774 type:complete len:89 (+) Transcript_17264:2561-2827(+)